MRVDDDDVVLFALYADAYCGDALPSPTSGADHEPDDSDDDGGDSGFSTEACDADACVLMSCMKKSSANVKSPFSPSSESDSSSMASKYM